MQLAFRTMLTCATRMKMETEEDETSAVVWLPILGDDEARTLPFRDDSPNPAGLNDAPPTDADPMIYYLERSTDWVCLGWR